MRRFFKKYKDIIPDRARERIQNILPDFRMIYSSEEARESPVHDLEIEKSYDIKEHGRKVRSSIYNENLEGIEKELQELYYQIILVEDFLERGKNTYISNIEDLFKKINNIKLRKEEISKQKSHLRTSQSHVINFHDRKNREKDLNLKFDKDGSLLEENKINPKSSILTLPKIESDNILKDEHNKATAKIRVNEDKSMASYRYKVSEPYNCLTIAPEHIWGEYYISEEPLQSEEGHGAYLEFELLLDKTYRINELSIDSVSSYPLTIHSIELYDDINIRVHPKNIIDGPIKLDDKDTISFDPTYARLIRFKVSQKNYDKKSLLINQRELNTSKSINSLLNEVQEDHDLWKMYLNHLENKLDTFASLEGRDDYIELLYTIISSLKELLGIDEEYLDVNSWFEDIDIDKKEVDKPLYNKSDYYVYYIGIKSIKASLNTYEKEGVYVSKSIKSQGTPMEISLETDEEYVGEDGEVAVEYFISYKDNPSYEQWVPILPINKDYIHREILKPDNNNKAKTNFAIDLSSVVRVYINNNEISDFQIEENNKIILDNVRPSDVISISYIPDYRVKDPWRINFMELDTGVVTKTEEFQNGTDRNGVITLSYFPYVDYDKAKNEENYAPVEVKMKDASIRGIDGNIYSEITEERKDNEPYLVNITDYTSRINIGPSPHSSDSAMAIEYLNTSNKLFFNETFSELRAGGMQTGEVGHGTIEVTYDTLAPYIRLKAIFRITDNEKDSVTPILKNYSINTNYNIRDIKILSPEFYRDIDEDILPPELMPGTYPGTYVHEQDTASSLWIIEHNMNKFPSVTVMDSIGREIIGTVSYEDDNNLTIEFSEEIAGTAYLN